MTRMQQIGYAFIYDKKSKEPLFVAGEIAGLLKEDISISDRYSGFDPETMVVIEFGYGENREDIENMGSWRIDGGDVVIIPRFTVSVSKDVIAADGDDISTITVNAPEDSVVTFIIEETQYEVPTDSNGNAALDFATEVIGDHFISIITASHGQGGVVIHAVQ